VNPYASPLRVYLILGLLACIGVYSGLKLPVSLFPLAYHPEIQAHVGLGSYSADEFLNTHGKDLEERLRHMQAEGISVEKLRAHYRSGDAYYDLTFNWGTKPADALRETQNLITSYASRFPQETRDSTWVWTRNQNSGFLALSIFSEKRSLDELYALVEPVLGPRLAAVGDAQNPSIWNPSSEEIRVELKPEAIASLQLFPRSVQAAISAALAGRAGGEIPVGDTHLSVELPRQVRSVAALGEITIATPSGQTVTLSDIARIDRGPKSNDRQSFRTGGTPSLILWASPKPGGNVKRMSEEILATVNDTLKSLPPDVQTKVLVDPSEFIRAAVRNVFTEVFLAALLAVAVLFIFIGSPRNILTAAIEIPLSIVLAFILMRLFGMNLNLISLGGLALSAGMNVDASVVVLENIFRHFEHDPGPHTASSRLKLVTAAVAEVRFPIVASTLVSLVVFLPLAMTSGLSQGILGDLALAVVFSHGFSAVVALLLVPTIRLQLMARGAEKPTPSPFESGIRSLETKYAQALRAFLSHPRWQAVAMVGLPIILAGLLILVLPRLPRELVGTPDTDRLVLGINTEGNTLIQQMELLVEQTEKTLQSEYGDKIASYFSQINGPNNGHIIARLKKRSDMNDVWKALEKRFLPTPLIRYGVSPWNPSELPIPDPPHLAVKVRGGTPDRRRLVAKGIVDLLRDQKIFENVNSSPSPYEEYAVRLSPNPSQTEALRASGSAFSVDDLADLVRVATTGRWTGYLPEELETLEILLYFPKAAVQSVEDIGSIPVGVAGKMVPLRALTEVKRVAAPPRIVREDGRPLFTVEARASRGEESKARKSAADAEKAVTTWLAANSQLTQGITVTFDDPAPELTEAINQLGKAMLLSLALIFVTLVFQFGTVVESLLVMVALPLGYIGVLLALYFTGSTLSLNSVLGVILLNGIAVANSILLVDFTKRLAAEGRAPDDAAVEAARVRLRPILITSLTTILGMTPLAFGLGEGGRILQPLGIAVAGGMWFSLALTLFVVPALHTAYLKSYYSSTESRWGRLRRAARVALARARRPSQSLEPSL
jgi:hydrophobic/amphiphilic exporter-1 (mainly G- bacteria), HAE1 family